MTFSVRMLCLCEWPAGSGTPGTSCWLEAAPCDPLSGIRFPSLHLPAMEERRGEEIWQDEMNLSVCLENSNSSVSHLPGSQTCDRQQ